MPRNHLPLSRIDVTAQEYADLAGNYNPAIAYYVDGVLKSIGGQPVTGTSGGVYIGQVASRCSAMTEFVNSNFQLMSRSKHYAMDNITSLAAVFANWWLSGPLVREQTTGGIATVRAAIEYPAGTIAAVLTFGGSQSGTIPDGATVASDQATLTIPQGAAFFVRTWMSNPAGIIHYAGSGLLNDVNAAVPDSGECWTFGVTTPDLTQTPGGFNNLNNSLCYRPAAIVGLTTKPSILLAGDSRQGNGNALDVTTDGYGLAGELGRALGSQYGVVNVSLTSEKAIDVITGSAYNLRATLAQYCSHIACGYGINDLMAGASAATVMTRLQTFLSRAEFASKPRYLATISPMSTSTDSWSTVAGQTTAASNAARVALNNMIRKVPTPLAGYLEVADATESSRNSGKWQAPGYTTDGLHGTSVANLAIAASGKVKIAGDVGGGATGQPVGVGGGGYSALADILALAEQATIANPRTRTPLTVATVNTAPAAGQVGYYNSGVSTSGYLQTQFAAGFAQDTYITYDKATQFQILGGTGFWVLNRQGVNAIFRNNGKYPDNIDIPCVEVLRITTDEDFPIITFAVMGNNQTVQFRVGDTLLSTEIAMPATASKADIKLDLSQLPSTGKFKTIDIVMEALSDVGVASVWVRPGKSVLGYPGKQPRILLLTDSLGATVSGGKGANAFGRTLADYLGQQSLVNIPAGGKGWVKPVGVPYIIEHLLSTRGESYDAIVIFHGLNDIEAAQADYSGAQKTVSQAVTETLAKIAQYAPTTPVIIGGSWPANSTSSATQATNYASAIAKENQIKASVDVAIAGGMKNVKFMPVMTAQTPWFTGHGNIENPGNTGNIEAMFSVSDTLHWVQAGHQIIAQRAAAALPDVLRTITL